MRQRELQSVMRRIAKGKISRGGAAQALDCSERQVNRLMLRYDVRRPPGASRRLREEARVRREKRVRAARRVLKGKISRERAAVEGEMSLRTVVRWVERLKVLNKSNKIVRNTKCRQL